ncbi:aminocarboxymuconate-semialdehyde decarboxylase [Caballeronia udeis]|uniref:Aminocarboxymuconate-semialdehyde decarboxylase n=2 Tax=Caballeronia udeis TaxID=1232866 RepID=A0A158JIL1_9BURK|nr:aminocarboxymuconate-semialdehyde decarboxylase [Caballeronia udeis]
MLRAGVDVQVVSPMPELLSYWLPVEDGATMCNFINEEIGKLVQRAPCRFVGLGAVPLQYPALACRVLEALMESGCFRGVEIGSNINGLPIGDPSFEEFFATAERLGACIFVHAIRPIGDERLVGPLSLRAVVSFPCEVSFAICSAVTGGLFTRHPALRIAFSHGGGAFGAVLPRLAHAWQNIEAIRSQFEEDPRVIAQRLFYDSLVYDPRQLRHMIEQFGATQILAGSDYPFDIADPEPVDSVLRVVNADQAELILHTNAENFLGVTP